MHLLCWPGVESGANGGLFGDSGVQQSNGTPPASAPGASAGSQALDADLFGGGLSHPSTTHFMGIPAQVSKICTEDRQNAGKTVALKTSAEEMLMHGDEYNVRLCYATAACDLDLNATFVSPGEWCFYRHLWEQQQSHDHPGFTCETCSDHPAIWLCTAPTSLPTQPSGCATLCLVMLHQRLNAKPIAVQ